MSNRRILQVVTDPDELVGGLECSSDLVLASVVCFRLLDDLLDGDRDGLGFLGI
jgi:hypothetical protein